MITEEEWASIRALVGSLAPKISGSRTDYIVTTKVIKRDELKKLIWVPEFGDQPIPLIFFDARVVYYDETPKGKLAPAEGAPNTYNTNKKTAPVEFLVPEIGETVVILRELGTQRLPRAIGVIQSTGWILSEEDDDDEF
jgi:hypothetical protein